MVPWCSFHSKLFHVTLSHYASARWLSFAINKFRWLFVPLSSLTTLIMNAFLVEWWILSASVSSYNKPKLLSYSTPLVIHNNQQQCVTWNQNKQKDMKLISLLQFAFEIWTGTYDEISFGKNLFEQVSHLMHCSSTGKQWVGSKVVLLTRVSLLWTFFYFQRESIVQAFFVLQKGWCSCWIPWENSSIEVMAVISSSNFIIDSGYCKDNCQSRYVYPRGEI